MDLFTILLLGSAQAAFLLALLLGKRGKTLPDWVLAAWVAMLGTHHLVSVLVGRGLVGPSAWLNVNAGVPLLQGPFLYVYSQALTSGRRRLGPADLSHLVPFVLFAAYLIWGLPAAGQTGDRVSIFRVSALFTAAILVSVPAYAVVEPDEPLRSVTPAPRSAKYERSGLGRDEIDSLVARLTRYLDEEKPYLEEGVTLRHVAARLGVSPNHVSQAINQGLDKNFYELINERRVDEFKRRVRDPKNRAFTLLGIAMDSGFSSKSSFNRVFKQFTGLSPQQYVDQVSTPDA